MDLKKLADQYKDELLDNVLPFWLEHSPGSRAWWVFYLSGPERECF